MHPYSIISGIKALLGIAILIITYTTINVYEDPAAGIGLGFLGVFITAWGASFYLFLWIQKLYRHIDQIKLIKDSYKLSLLFGIYVIINFLLLVGGYRNKRIGLLLLGGFVRLQVTLFSDHQKANEQ